MIAARWMTFRFPGIRGAGVPPAIARAASMANRARPIRLAVLAGLLLCIILSPRALADVITAGGTRLADIRVQTVRGGQVFFTDAGGDLKQVDAATISAIRFDGLVELDDAERFLSRGEVEDALDKLLAGYARATTEPQRMWLHARLATAHNLAGDYIEAASNLAALLELDPSPVWTRLVPTCGLNEPTFNSAAEAITNIDRARRKAAAPDGDVTVRETLDRLDAAIRPLFDRVQQDNAQRRYRAGSTVSGIPMRDLGKPRPGRSGTGRVVTPPGATPPAPPLTRPGTTPPGDSPPATPGDPDSAESIERLLAASKFDEALKACERAARNPVDRDLGQLLVHRGLALNGLGRPMDAAVAFMQAVIHFPGGRAAARGLIETGLIYRDALKNPDVARRLFEEAARIAEQIGDAALAERARSLLANAMSVSGQFSTQEMA